MRREDANRPGIAPWRDGGRGVRQKVASKNTRTERFAEGHETCFRRIFPFFYQPADTRTARQGSWKSRPQPCARPLASFAGLAAETQTELAAYICLARILDGTGRGAAHGRIFCTRLARFLNKTGGGSANKQALCTRLARFFRTGAGAIVSGFPRPWNASGLRAWAGS